MRKVVMRQGTAMVGEAPHDSCGAPRPESAPRLRRGRREDLDALWRLERQSFDSDRLSRRQWRHHLASPRARVLLAEDDQGLAGALLLLYRADSRAARIHSIAVAARARGRGLGRSLLDAARRQALADRRKELRLEVRDDNVAAQRLYAAAGFRRFGRIPGYYADGCAAQRWRLPLEATASGDAKAAGLR